MANTPPDEPESIEEPDVDATTLGTAVSTNYKVRGRVAAPDGTGVLGHNTATTGAAHGVEGVADSTDIAAAGVHGEAPGGSGRTYGVEGITRSSHSSAAGVRADAPNGATGVLASSTDESAVHGKSDVGLGGEFRTSTGGTALLGWNGSTADTPNQHGIQGSTNAVGILSSGVRGRSRAATGTTYGVSGLTDSTGNDTAGVYGLATQASGHTFGVHGETDSTDGGATGVRGEARGSSGQTYGVYGETHSPRSDAAGVRARGSNASATGVFATGSTAVWAQGRDEGLRASAPPDAYSVNAESNVNVDGYVEIGETGVQVYPGGSGQTITSGTRTTVEFGSVVADPRGEFDTSTNAFSPDVVGDYRVNAQVLWGPTAPSAGTQIQTEIWRSGSLVAQDYTNAVGGNLTSTSVSKTLMGLGPSETVTIGVRHEDGNGLSLDPDPDDTYASFIRVG